MQVLKESAADVLENAFPGAVLRDVSLATISRWRIGGRADVIARPRNIEELCHLRAFLAAADIRHVVIGATSNLLFADEGLRAVAVQIGHHFSSVVVSGKEITAGAGAWVPGLARRAMQAGLAGIEHTCGIPGTLGGLVCMNGGSQRRGIGEAITEVTSVDSGGRLLRRDAAGCGFAYRRSAFQGNDEVVVSARLELTPALVRGDIRRRMLAIMGDRRRKFPHHTPNCGSVFVSNPAMYAQYGPPGAVIERLGFKGRRIGGAEVSPQHANFIINSGGARAQDVLGLITGIKTAVHRETGYDMEVEARYVRPDGAMVPADYAAID
ncbi:UDP-N-acetylmuramate dehydrogenase [Mesorhizobium sp. M0684]|uniref:UDP-N-acetylmuramate dehydrogenase n=1 Tax=Mesorhizobium sp. M0684 TaxID=2956986 RepID=UPI003335B1E7